MSYQVLARKWRPKSFAELMGQDHVVAVLSNALSQQRLHHAYLFTGTRGVGKTTIARIFAKSLNCVQGVSATPCGQCDVCQDIDQGRFVDLIEIDAASRTKVDDTREILDNVQYAPSRGRYKVYLIDEVHMLSRSSFNALLKTLEEPPEHVKFILATTDPQKLPITVLSRCLQFHLKALTVKQIEKKLAEILSAEHVKVEALALTMLAKAARGSMRDSLSLTDQAMAQGNGEITTANLQQMLGGVDHNWVYKILIALIKSDSQGLMALSLDIASYSPNYSRLLAELIQLLHQIAMAQVVETHFDLTPEHNVLLEKFAKAMSPEDVQLYYQIALNGRKDLPYASDEQSAFDMVLLRLLAFKPQQSAQTLSHDQSPQVAVDFEQVNLADTSLPAEKNSETTPIEQASVAHAESQLTTTDAHQTAENIKEADLANEMLAIEQQAVQLSAAQNTETEQQPEATVPQEAHEDNVIQAFEDNGKSSDNASPTQQYDDKLITEQTGEKPVVSSEQASDISSVIARRNMLRSQKQALENAGKKPKDASERQEAKVTDKATKDKLIDVPDLATVPEQPFTEQAIDPSIVKKANQVDKWANMIDAMALNGRLRQLALNAIINPESNDEQLILSLNQSTKHLKSEAAMVQLNQFVSDYFEKPMSVEVIIVEETNDDPAKIQQKINDKRYEYAKELLKSDELVIAMQEEFQAQLHEDTIEAR